MLEVVGTKSGVVKEVRTAARPSLTRTRGRACQGCRASVVPQNALAGGESVRRPAIREFGRFRSNSPILPTTQSLTLSSAAPCPPSPCQQNTGLGPSLRVPAAGRVHGSVAASGPRGRGLETGRRHHIPGDARLRRVSLAKADPSYLSVTDNPPNWLQPPPRHPFTACESYNQRISRQVVLVCIPLFGAG